jgi:hypothetical protein
LNGHRILLQQHQKILDESFADPVNQSPAALNLDPTGRQSLYHEAFERIARGMMRKLEIMRFTPSIHVDIS